MAALEAQSICGAQWLSEAHESFTDFTPLAQPGAEGFGRQCDLRRFMSPVFDFVFFSSTWLCPDMECLWSAGTDQGGAETRPGETMDEPALGHTGSVVQNEG